MIVQTKYLRVVVATKFQKKQLSFCTPMLLRLNSSYRLDLKGLKG